MWQMVLIFPLLVMCREALAALPERLRPKNTAAARQILTLHLLLTSTLEMLEGESSYVMNSYAYTGKAGQAGKTGGVVIDCAAS